MLYIDLRPGQTCHSKVMHRKEVTHSNGSYEKKSRRRTWLTVWDRVKIPRYTHRLMHRKRVTCELHDSYFRLMVIKHAIPKTEWAMELLYNSVRIGRQLVGDQMSWRQDAVEKAIIQQRTGPLGPRLSSPGERERHTVMSGGAGGGLICCSLSSVSNSFSHANLAINWEVYFFKEVFARLLLLLCRWFCVHMHTYICIFTVLRIQQ